MLRHTLTRALEDLRHRVAAGSPSLTVALRYVRLSVTLGTAGADAAAFVLGLDPRYGAANAGDIAAVDEIVG